MADLTDHRHLVEHRLAEAGGVDRHVAPADQLLALDADEVLELAHRQLARRLVARHEAHGDAVAAGFRQLEALLGGPVTEQGVGDLDQAAGAVTHQRIGAHGAAVVQVDQDLQAALDDLVGFAALEVDHKAHAARVLLVTRIIESLLRRERHLE